MNVFRFSGATLCGALALTGCSNGSGTFSGTTIGTAAATLNTTTLAFGTVPLGQTSASQTITVTNTGAGAGLAISAVRTSGADYTAFLSSSACPASLARGVSCTITVAYSPTASANQSGSLIVVDNANNSPQQVALSGTGSSSGPVVSLSANALNFARLPVGQASTQTVTLTNIGNLPLGLAGFTVGGGNATSFAVSGSCLTTGTLATGGNCFLTVTYAPTVAGMVSGVINVNDNAANTPQLIRLSST